MRKQSSLRAVLVGVVALAVMLGATIALAGDRLRQTSGDGGDDGEARLTKAPGNDLIVPGSTRLVLVGPRVLLDSQLPPGGEASATAAGIPPGTSAVLLEISLLNAGGPGAVTVGDVTVLRLPRAKAMTSATVVVGVDRGGELRLRTEGGGRLLANLVGAFEPVDASTSGRIVPVPATQVLRLVPATDGKYATVDLKRAPALRNAGSYAAVMLQVSADVGANGGFLEVGKPSGPLDQKVYWTATAAGDRTRNGFLVVPVTGDTISLHYQAGSLLTVDVVGYVTDDKALPSIAGLTVPVRSGSGQPTRVGPAGLSDITVVPAAGVQGVPADRVAGVLVGVGALGEGVGSVTVYPPDAPPPAGPTLATSRGVARQVFTAVGAANGAVRVQSTAGASVSLTVQALILAG